MWKSDIAVIVGEIWRVQLVWALQNALLLLQKRWWDELSRRNAQNTSGIIWWNKMCTKSIAKLSLSGSHATEHYIDKFCVHCFYMYMPKNIFLILGKSLVHNFCWNFRNSETLEKNNWNPSPPTFICTLELDKYSTVGHLFSVTKRNGKMFLLPKSFCCAFILDCCLFCLLKEY